jgi:hypothetical protein
LLGIFYARVYLKATPEREEGERRFTALDAFIPTNRWMPSVYNTGADRMPRGRKKEWYSFALLIPT